MNVGGQRNGSFHDPLFFCVVMDLFAKTYRSLEIMEAMISAKPKLPILPDAAIYDFWQHAHENIKEVRAKLTLWYSALFAFTMIAFAVAAQALRSRALLNQFDAELRDELRWAEILLRATKVEALLTEGEVKAALATKIRDDIAKHFMLNCSTHVLEIRARTGQFIYRSVSPDDTLSQLFDAGVRFDHPMTVAYGKDDFRVLQEQTPHYRINLAVSLRPLYDIEWQLARTFLWLFPLSMAVAVGGGWLLAKYSMRAVTRVIQAARQITATNLSQRLPVYAARDEIGALVETVNDLIARIEHGVGRIEQFSQNVAHELRTPLTILRGEMELALSGKAGAAELRRIIASALEEISRASKTVQSVLFLGHVDFGETETKNESVALDQLAPEVFEDAQALAEGRHLHLTLNAPSPVVVAGDASRLRRLLLNLVENAIKYTPEGKVEIAVRRADAQAIITVSDTGIGIAPEHLEYIFERFYRVDPDRSRETGGSGLGLSICAAIAHAHGGEIRVESPAFPSDSLRNDGGKGSTFEVKLPLAVTQTASLDTT